MKKEILFNVITLLITLFLVFLVIELGFKVLHLFSDAEVGPSEIRGLPYENTPNGWFLRYSQAAGWVFYKHNSLGMRDLERSYEKTPGTKRILILGDSVMYGGEVKFNNIFSRQLENMFKDNNVEVLNSGTTSYSLKEYPVYLKEKGLKFSPDIVVVGLCLNDYDTSLHKEANEAEEDVLLKKKNVVFSKLKRLFHSYFAEYLYNVYKAFTRKNPEFSHGEVYTKEVWDKNYKYFKALKDTAQAEDVELVILLLPIGHQYDVEEVRNVPQKYIISILDELDIHYVNPYSSFESALTSGEDLFKKDYTHFSGAGHRICATDTYKFIKEEKLL